MNTHFREDYMKKIKYLIILTSTQLISWIIFILLDYLLENLDGSLYGTMILASFIIPILISILYLVNENKICNITEITKLKFNIIVTITWIVETAIIGSYICNRVNYNKWIIIQHNSGIFSLNGIEYFIFSFGLAAIPIIINVVVKTVKFIYSKIIW